MQLPEWAKVVIYVLGAAGAVSGFWLIVYRPEPDEEVPAGEGVYGRMVAWRAGLSAGTRLAWGYSLLLMGYHGAAWIGPEKYFGLKVPLERWWILVIGVVLGVVGSWAADWLERRNDERAGE
ncbi:MAG: hypothetical protein JSR77_10080 [Planctomycetes bacterium]|nr:hypothetical protein [Planctomycetota bacterium]